MSSAEPTSSPVARQTGGWTRAWLFSSHLARTGPRTHARSVVPCLSPATISSQQNEQGERASERATRRRTNNSNDDPSLTSSPSPGDHCPLRHRPAQHSSLAQHHAQCPVTFWSAVRLAAGLVGARSARSSCGGLSQTHSPRCSRPAAAHHLAVVARTLVRSCVGRGAWGVARDTHLFTSLPSGQESSESKGLRKTQRKTAVATEHITRVDLFSSLASDSLLRILHGNLR